MESKQAVNKFSMVAALGLLATFISFMIGFWHAGQGLSYFKILDLEYGGFIAAAGILAILIIAYSKAILGSYLALLIYIIFATITFVCNMNSFYPNYRGDPLIREELKNHEQMLVKLKEGVADDLKDPKLAQLREEIEALKKALKIQTENYGIGPKAKDLVRKIEAKLNLPGGSITTINSGKTLSEWKDAAERMTEQVDKQFEAFAAQNKGQEKLELVRNINEHHMLFSEKIKMAIDAPIVYKTVPAFVNDIIRAQKEVCEAAKSLGAKNQDKYCAQNYRSPNMDIGGFSHTIRSSIETLSDDGTKVIIAFCFFLDYLFPLAIYLLVRRKQGGNRQPWRVGRDYKPQSSE